jgi:PEP-CTERM motif
MKDTLRAGAVAVLALVAIEGRAQASPIIFNDLAREDFQSVRGAGSSPLADITVSVATSIDQIGVHNDLSSDGNLKFLIFDLDSHALLFQSGPQAFVDNGLSFKLSNPFAPFILLPGINYGIGAVADVAGNWGINNTSFGNPFTQNGITASDDRNGNVTSFASPALGGEGTAMIIIELAGGPAATPVPEPGTLLLVGGAAACAALRRRFRTPV